MTSPPKPSLSERMRRWVCYANDADGQPTGYASEVDQQVDEWADEVIALERAKREQDERLAGLVGGPKGMRYHAGIAYSAGRFDLGELYHAWADELHAATKGEE